MTACIQTPLLRENIFCHLFSHFAAASSPAAGGVIRDFARLGYVIFSVHGTHRDIFSHCFVKIRSSEKTDRNDPVTGLRFHINLHAGRQIYNFLYISHL
jgi:hypothetical protein